MGKLSNRLEQIQAKLTADQLVNVGYPVFVENTARRSGNARRNTRKTSSEIRADYAYASRLDQGWSKQRPNGMTKPTKEAIRQYIKKTLG